ncbi:CapA family protein [Picosynechococcus sp. PCC 7117]|uniref:CapA family protein n=1 Tax=Picosynechococcus sp. PCC 7117 TaxID=195498 RepID=UPI000ADCD31D|nr:CapA family protein [Picosynechococcus sp. PCC 7117]
MAQFPLSTVSLRRWLPWGLGSLTIITSLGILGFRHYQRQQVSFISTSVAISNSTLATIATDAAKAIAPVPQTKTTVVTLKAVGDMAPGTRYSKTPQVEQKMQMFAGVEGQLGWSDLLIGNLETTLTNHPYAAKDISRPNVFAFRTAPSYANLLKDAGFQALSIANNHTFDYGQTGFQDTQTTLTDTGIAPIGVKNQIHYHQHKDLTVALIGFSTYQYHNTVQGLDAAVALVKEADAKADIIVISVHAGAEGTGANRVRPGTEWLFGENRGDLHKFSRTLIDAGADLIVGHGPHVLRAVELYQGRLIAYSLGNFVADGALSVASTLAESVILEVSMSSEGRFLKGKLHPVRLNGQGFPFYDATGTAIKRMQQLTQRDFPETPLTIQADGQLLPRTL